MVKYTLHYFKSRGQGECARLLLAYGGEEWEDKRYTIEEFRRTLKNSMPNGQLPVLEAEGKLLSQSYAIYRYLARKYELTGKDNWEAAIVDSIMDQYKDYFEEIRDYILTAAGFINKGDLDTLREKLYVPASAKFFPILKNYIKEAGNGYLTKGGPTWADFFFAENFDGLKHLVPNFYEDHPEFKRLNEQVHLLPQLQKYLQSRPQLAL